jgi:DNA-binding NarL/FixJ family response regulator
VAGALSIPGHQLATGLRVALVDTDPSAHEFVREAFAAHANGWVLESHQGPDTLLAVRRRPGIRHSARPAPPDFILVDTDRPGITGVDAVRRLAARLPKPRVMMFTSCSEGATIIRAVGAGACGYLIKPVVPDYLVYAVSEAAAGRAIFCNEAQTAMVEYVRRTGAAKGCRMLSWREREIMLLVMRGATNKEISKELGIDQGTVHWHINNTFKKMQVHSKGEARRKFAREG